MGGPCDRPHIHSADYISGAILVKPGDWIIADQDGIHYDAINPDVFESTYESLN